MADVTSQPSPPLPISLTTTVDFTGKIVHQAAARHLTPTTLELGGKSPVYLDDTVDMATAVRRILWGKCLNAGQTCVSPDYLLCSKGIQDQFLEQARHILREFYGDDPLSSPHLGRIVTQRHFDRLVSLLSGGKVVLGGHYDACARIFTPTILTDVTLDSALMREEIFGPILPIVNVNSAMEAVAFVNARDKPLALYVFSEDSGVQRLFIEGTSSGAVTLNDTVMHVLTENLPFGGVGGSGMGAYHGKHGFETFTHQKSVLVRPLSFVSEITVKARYPPYSDAKRKLLSGLVRKRRGISLKWLPIVVTFALGLGLGFGANYFYRKYRDEL